MHTWNLKNKINNNNKNRNKLIDIENILRVIRWGVWGASVKREEGIKKYKLVVTK